MDDFAHYAQMHDCRTCFTTHYLAVLPDPDGWVVGVRCSCRGADGGPRPYSRESVPLPTFQAAERERDDLLKLAVAA